THGRDVVGVPTHQPDLLLGGAPLVGGLPATAGGLRGRPRVGRALVSAVLGEHHPCCKEDDNRHGGDYGQDALRGAGHDDDGTLMSRHFTGGVAVRTLPRWRQISDDLLRRLQDGEFVDGFPGELALSERYEVSRGTIRQALAPLREQGIVGGGRGRPSYVINTSRTSGFGPMYSLREAITARGGTESSQVLAQRLVTSKEVATALDLDLDTPFVQVTRVRTADGTPFALDRLWI